MHSNIIEFIGAPGVGKSSIYNRLCQKWHTKQPWIYPDVLLMPQKPSIFQFKKWADYSTRRILGRKLHHTLPVNLGFRFIQQHETLADFYWSHFSNSDFPVNRDISLRFRSVFLLFRALSRYQAILEAECDKVCLLDEGLLQKSFLIHENQKAMSDLLDEYLVLVPLPRAIFWVDIDDIEVILNRIKHRQKIVASHIGKDDMDLIKDAMRWQQLVEIIAEKMDNNQVRVFKINGEMPIEDNVVRIQKTIFDF